MLDKHAKILKISENSKDFAKNSSNGMLFHLHLSGHTDPSLRLNDKSKG